MNVLFIFVSFLLKDNMSKVDQKVSDEDTDDEMPVSIFESLSPVTNLP